MSCADLNNKTKTTKNERTRPCGIAKGLRLVSGEDRSNYSLTSPAQRVRDQLRLLICPYAHMPYADIPRWTYLLNGTMLRPSIPFLNPNGIHIHYNILTYGSIPMPIFPNAHMRMFIKGGHVETIDTFPKSKRDTYSRCYTYLWDCSLGF